MPELGGPPRNSENQDTTFHHLYEDCRRNHYPKVIDQWERFENRFARLGRNSRKLCEWVVRRLEEELKLPPMSNSSQRGNWVNYLRAAIFVYERLWSNNCGSLQLYQENPGGWILRWNSTQVAQGTKERMEDCLAAIERQIISGKAGIDQLLVSRGRLKQEAQRLQDELGKTLLRMRLPGNCPYTKVKQF